MDSVQIRDYYYGIIVHTCENVLGMNTEYT